MKQRLLRFLISGGSAAGIEYAVFVGLQSALGTGAFLANQALSFGCGFIVSFLLNRRWVFQSDGHMGHELLKYSVAATINLAAGSIAIYLMVIPGGLHPYLAKFLVMGMIAAWNYFVLFRLVFRKSE